MGNGTSCIGKIEYIDLKKVDIFADIENSISHIESRTPKTKSGKVLSIYDFFQHNYAYISFLASVFPEGFSPAENTVLCITPPGRSSCTCHSSTPPFHVADSVATVPVPFAVNLNTDRIYPKGA